MVNWSNWTLRSKKLHQSTTLSKTSWSRKLIPTSSHKWQNNKSLLKNYWNCVKAQVPAIAALTAKICSNCTARLTYQNRYRLKCPNFASLIAISASADIKFLIKMWIHPGVAIQIISKEMRTRTLPISVTTLKTSQFVQRKISWMNHFK